MSVNSAIIRAGERELEYGIMDMFTGIAPLYSLPQIQPSIIEFAEHPEFCGKVLYPRQKTLLKIMFLQDELFDDYDHHVIGEWLEQSKKFDTGPPNDVRVPLDLYDRIRRNKENGRTHFREIIDIGGRRGGKGYVGGITGAYLTYETLRLDDPQRFYGIDADKDLYINIVATSTTQARKYLFADVAAAIISCKSLRQYIWKVQEEEVRIQTPANLRHMADLRAKRVKMNKDVASLRITANSSTSAAGRGGAAYAQMFDEFAHVIESDSSRSGGEIYEAYTPSLDQIGIAALIYIPSSPYCLEPSTRVLTEDLRWVPVGTLEVGDRLIGFDEEHGGAGKGRTWQPATVTDTSVIHAPRYELKTESGKTIVCTGEHMWLTSWASQAMRYGWVKTKDLNPGDRIKTFLADPWETDDSRDAGYLAGFLDGEGHWGAGTNTLGLTQNKGTVLDSVCSMLDDKGFDYTTHECKKKPELTKSYLTGGLGETLRLLGSIRPERLIGKLTERLYGCRIYGNKKQQQNVDRVVSVTLKDEGDVVALETSTGTLVAEGLLSHNTKIGKFHELYQAAFETDEFGNAVYPEMLAFQHPSWALYEDWEYDKRLSRPIQQYDDQMKQLEQRNPQKFKVERRARFASTIDAYLDPEIVDRMFEPFPGKDEENRVQLKDSGEWSRLYRFHCDPGKCVRKGSLVPTNRGLLPIEEVLSGDACVTSDGNDTVLHAYPSGKKEILRASLTWGYGIEGSREHPVLSVSDGVFDWKMLDELLLHDTVIVQRGQDVDTDSLVPVPTQKVFRSGTATCATPKEVDRDFATILGHLVAEGGCSRNDIRFTSADPESMGEFVSLVRSVFGIEPSETRECQNMVRYGNTSFASLLESVGLNLGHSRDKEVPWAILRSPKEIQSAYLRAYADGDGRVQNDNDASVWLYTASETMSRQLQTMLLGMGILSNRHSRKTKTPTRKIETTYWYLVIRGDNLKKFVSKVGFGLPRKMSVAQDILSCESIGTHPKVDRIPLVASGSIERLHHRFHRHGDGTILKRNGVWVTRPTVTRLRSLLSEFSTQYPEACGDRDYQFLLSLCRDDWFYASVESVLPVGEDETYDLEMSGGLHNFVADGVVVHNSQANFCTAGGHLEEGPDGFYHCYIDYMKVWQPGDFPVDPVAKVPWVDYVKITKSLIDLSRRFPIDDMTFDQWNNVMSMQTIRNAVMSGISINKSMTVRQVTFTQKENWKRYEQFKSIAYMGWIHIPVYEIDVPSAGGIVNLASEEMKYLVEKNGKVDRQETGPITTKDLSDTIMVVATDLLGSQLAMLDGDAMSSTLVVPAVRGDYMRDTQVTNQQQTRPKGSSRGRMDKRTPFDEHYERKGKVLP